MTSSDNPTIEPPSDPSPRRRRRSFVPRFGLRSLLLVSLLACPLFAWVGSNVHRARQEDAAIEMLRRAGAGIELHGDKSFAFADEERLNEEVDRGKATSFLDLAIGRSTRPKVRAFSLDHRTAPHATIRAAVDGVRHLPEIERVALWGTFFDDEVCDSLSQLPKLETLSLRGTSVTERGLSRLEALSRLQTITISDPTSTNAAAALSRLKPLRTITLFNLYVSRDDIAGIATLPELQTLELVAVASKDEYAFQPLSAATTLRTLVIMGVWFDEDDLPAFAGLQNLESLSIRVEDDDCLAHFAGLPKLRRLDLSGGATSEAVRRFSAEHPRLLIEFKNADGETSERYLNGEPADYDLFNEALRDDDEDEP